MGCWIAFVQFTFVALLTTQPALLELVSSLYQINKSPKETLENPSHPRENTRVITGTDWVHGQQAARLALRARLRLR